MAHFAKISENNEILNVLYISNEDAPNEAAGKAHLEKHNDWPANLWIQTSYNTFQNKHYYFETLEIEGVETYTKKESPDQSKALRGNYAQKGGTWDPQNEIFWPKKPYPSWVKNIAEARWQSPVGDRPITEEQRNQNIAGTHNWVYTWNEQTQNWDLTNNLA